MIFERTPDCAEAMAQQCARLIRALCKSTTRAEDQGHTTNITKPIYEASFFDY